MPLNGTIARSARLQVVCRRAQKTEKKKEKREEPNFKFGWINIMLIFGIGALVCVKLGLFDGDNVPGAGPCGCFFSCMRCASHHLAPWCGVPSRCAAS